MLEADYVVVGAGSAGCALAYRLSEDGKHSVIVIEYGGTDIGPLIQMPSALSFPMNMSLYDWGLSTEPEPHLGGRVLATPRGKVIGGSSSINGMVYVRGHARDFDHWAEAGATGWGYADVLPYFKRMEHSHGGEEGWRGTEGAAARAPRHARKPALPGLRGGRAAGGLRDDGRLQRVPAGRLRPDGADDPSRPPLVGRQCLSAPGAEARKRAPRQRAGPPRGDGEPPRGRRRDRHKRAGAGRAGAARGDPRRLLDQFAPSS
jgi:choline dehydrogenase-like flavoprotein